MLLVSIQYNHIAYLRLIRHSSVLGSFSRACTLHNTVYCSELGVCIYLEISLLKLLKIYKSLVQNFTLY